VPFDFEFGEGANYASKFPNDTATVSVGIAAVGRTGGV
jgi:hypothetical protein